MKKVALWSMLGFLTLNLPVMSVSADYSSASYKEGEQVKQVVTYEEVNAEEQVRAFVERMYTIVLGREAEAGGLDYWTAQLLSHDIDGAGIADGFVMSEEVLEKAVSNEEYVNILYRTFMDREADDGGRAYWIDLMEQGKSKGAVLAGFVNSPEFQEICISYGILPGSMDEEGRVIKAGVRGFVDRLYTNVLCRTPDESGAQHWVSQITSNILSAETAAKCFFDSEEFVNRNVSNEEYVEILCTTFMGRDIDAEGKAYWVGQLTNGMGRMDVLEGFSRSPEFSNILRSYGLGVPYFEEYAIPVQDQITDFVSTGIIYDGDTVGYGDEYVDYLLCEWDTKITELSRTALENGYEKIVLQYEASTDLIDSWDGSYTWCTTFSRGLYDYHTGIKLKSRSTSGNDGFTSVTPITFNDKVYDISYTQNASWEYSDWEYIEMEDVYKCRATVTVTQEVKVPAGYDGLILGVYPKTKYTTSNSSSISDEIYYAPTELDEGDIFYRINP